MKWNTPAHSSLNDPDNDNGISGMFSELEQAEYALSQAYDAYDAATTDAERAAAVLLARHAAAKLAALRGVSLDEVFNG